MRKEVNDMEFEKINSSSVVSPMSGCSGCSNNGKQVYSGNYSSQSATNAGRCTAK